MEREEREERVGGATEVAQVSNLLYRGFPIRSRASIPAAWAFPKPCRLEADAGVWTFPGGFAGWKPAIRQVGNLRYGALTLFTLHTTPKTGSVP